MGCGEFGVEEVPGRLGDHVQTNSEHNRRELEREKQERISRSEKKIEEGLDR